MNRLIHTLFLGTFICSLSIMSSQPGFAQPLKQVYFDEILRKRLPANTKANDWDLETFCPVSSDVLSRRVLQSYGSMFVATDSVTLPMTCVFKGEGDVRQFQYKLPKKQLYIDGVPIEIQPSAATALESAIAEVSNLGARITPLDGAIAGGRTYGNTLMLWNSRFFPALEFWVKQGKLSVEERDDIARLDLQKKIEKVLEWESRGIFFSTDKTRSILTSTAPPGTSQHLALLAFDVTEFWDSDVRVALNRNGWFQTVIDDPAHFTFLGFPESDLPARGLISIAKDGRQYWVPNLPPLPISASPTN